MSTRNVLHYCLMCSFILLVSLRADAQQEKQPFEFSGPADPVILAPGGETRIQVLNNTTRPLTLNLAIVDEAAEGSRTLSSLSLAQSKLKLAPAGVGTIVLRSQSIEALKLSTAPTAYLVLSDNSSGAVRRRAIKLNLPKQQGLPPLTSAVGALKSTVYYWPGPFVNKQPTLDVPLPLNAKVARQELEDRFKVNPSLGLLADESGETAVVNYQGVKDDLPSGTTGIVLGLKGSRVPGIYAGPLSEIKTEDGKPVTLTITVAHAWLFPALVCFAGIVAYYLMQRYLSVGRKVRELQEQEAMLGVDFALAAERFSETADGRGYAKDTIKSDFDNQRSVLLKRIDGLRLKNFLKLDQDSDAYKEVVKQLGELEEVTRSWSAFAEQKLNLLDDALVSASSGFNLRPPDESLAQQAAPALASEAARVLTPRIAAMTIAEFKARAARVGELLPLLTSWERLNGWAATTWRRYDDIIKAPGFNDQEPLRKEKIKSERDRAFTIWRTLWVRESFDLASLDAELVTLDNSLANLAAENAPGASASLQPSAAEESIDGPAGRGVAPAERVMNLATRRLRWDLFYLALVTAVAVYSGLTLLYFDKPFGTRRDYLDMLVWGFGTKVIIDAVTGAINRFLPATVR